MTRLAFGLEAAGAAAVIWGLWQWSAVAGWIALGLTLLAWAASVRAAR